MVPGISFSGIGAGFDTRAIIDALIDAERAPLRQLEARRTAAQQKVSLIGTFQGLVRTLRDKAADLGRSSQLSSYAVSSSTDGFAAFSASSSATAGPHSLVVETLAGTDRWAFNAVVDPDADLAVGLGEAVSFDYEGTSYSVSLDPAASSLREVAAGINTATNGAVNASVVNTGPASSPAWQLVLAASDTGADFRITGVNSTIAGLTIDGTAPTGAGVAASVNNLTVGNDAVALVDGLRVQRSSNDFSDVIPGVSITLQQADPATTTTFTVAPDKEAIKAKLAGFVAAYNAVIAFDKKQNTYDSEAGKGGALFGDSALRRVRNILNDTLFGQTAAQVGTDTEGYGTLRLLGIESNDDGTLAIDDTAMSAKIDANIGAFLEFFVDSDGFNNGGAAVGTPGYYVDTTLDTGFGDDLARALGAAIDTYDDGAGGLYEGLFEARTDGLGQEIALYDSRIETGERRLTVLEVSLVARFSALESLLGRLNSQGGYLTQALASLGTGQ